MNIQGSNSKLVRVHNRALILRLIQQNQSITRKQLSEKTALTQPAITRITNDLIDRGLVVEEEDVVQRQGVGRRPIGLSINREKYKIVAVNIGRTMVQAAICDLSGRILYKQEEYRDIFTEFTVSFEQDILSFVEKLIAERRIEGSQLLGIAIAAPGPINAKRGILHNSVFSAAKKAEAPFDWGSVNLNALFGERFGVPVFSDNEANVAALGESWFGAGASIDNFVVYSVGLGIGSGVIIDGMLYRGEDDVVSEIGHITIDYKGPQCPCGNVGCLELYASFWNLVRIYREAGKGAGGEGLKARGASIVQDIEGIFQNAKEGDVDAIAALEFIGEFLGIGAVSLANIFSPERIILSGNDTGDADLGLMVPIVQNSVSKGAFSVIANKVKVMNSSLGRDGRLYGGVALVLQDFFNQSIDKRDLDGDPENRP